MEASDFQVFEFTTQEKNSIKEVLESLAEITCVLLAEGVKTDEVPNINVFDIISHIMESSKEGRGGEFRFAVLGVTQQNGMLKVVANKSAIAEKSVEFLEGILMRQLAYFERKIPKAVELFKHKNLGILDGRMGVKSAQKSKAL